MGWGVLAIGVVAIAWIVVTGLLARSHLNQVRSDLPKLRSALTSGDLTRARALANDVDANARTAHDLSTGPAWWVASNIPVVGSPLQTSRTLAEQADRVGQSVLPGVLVLANDLANMPHVHNSTIDLQQVVAAEPMLRSAATAAHRAVQAVDRSSPSWLGYVSSARGSVASTLRELDGELSGANRAIQVLVPMLGESGQKTYMIGFLNDAESRGLGGIPGAFAIVTADHGKITFTHFGSDEDLHGVTAKVNLGSEFNARYGADDPTGDFRNSDLSPDFRDAAQIWVGMWEAKTGQHLDGALAVDPTALSYLLKATGPTQLPDGSQVSAQNVVALTQQTQYVKYGSERLRDRIARKDYLASLAKAIAAHVTKAVDANRTVQALSHAARDRRLVVWSSDSGVEKLITAGGWGGVLDAAGAPFSGLTVNNAAGTKLDYYLHSTMSYRRLDCGPGGVAVVNVTLTNAAPKSGLPVYVTTRGDHPPAGSKPGDNKLIVTYYATSGAELQSITLNGVPLIVATVPENGLVTATVTIEIPAGATKTLHIVSSEPATNQPVQLLRQPMVNPIVVTAKDDCG